VVHNRARKGEIWARVGDGGGRVAEVGARVGLGTAAAGATCERGADGRETAEGDPNVTARTAPTHADPHTTTYPSWALGGRGPPVSYDLTGMRHCLRSRGFTLIEVMIVVVVIGVLSLLAIVAYRRWVRTSYMAEAQDMVQNIRQAEESFKAETGGYLNVSSTLDLGFTYPAATPGAFKTGWGGNCGTCAVQWTSLAVEPKGPVAFGYAVVADNSGAVPGANVTAATSKLATSISLAGLAGQPWYVVEAVGDINGDTIYTRLIGTSQSSQVTIDREGE